MTEECVKKSLDFLDPILQRDQRDSPRTRVILSWAQSLDGFLSLKKGSQTAISCRDSHLLVHVLRSKCDGILVGINTILADDPSLTCRLPGNTNHPGHLIPIVFDSHLKTPVNSKIIKNHPILFTTAQHDSQSIHALEEAGASIVILEEDLNSHIPILKALDVLQDRFRIKNLLVEGGSKIIQCNFMYLKFNIKAFLSCKRVDAMIVTISPQIFTTGVHLGFDFNDRKDPIKLNNAEWKQFGSDMVMRVIHPFSLAPSAS